MGYYTRYHLRYIMDKDNPNWKNFENRLWEYLEEGKDSDKDDLDWYGIWNSINQDDDCKWYSHTDDMIFISKMFPMILFSLTGEGEQQGDIWIEYYKDGKHLRQVPFICWPEFNEEMLK